uniref:HTH_Tnp_Tc3_1 domain-containing protein n=1 Tax=Steinernema glaseri TaxID=37863 RepID=A0A1I8A9E6_9BILA
MPQPAQHPPHMAGKQGALGIVDHDLHAITQAALLQKLRQLLTARQRMTTIQTRLGSCQIDLVIQEHRTRNMPLFISASSCLMVGQIMTYIQNQPLRVRQADNRPDPIINAMPAQANQSGTSPQKAMPIRAAKIMVVYCKAAVNKAEPNPKARVMRTYLHHGHRAQGTGTQAQHRRPPLVRRNAGAQDTDHAHKAQQHRNQTHGITLGATPGKHPESNKQGSGVVQADGCRQRQIGQSQKTQPHGTDPGDITSDMQFPALRSQP